MLSPGHYFTVMSRLLKENVNGGSTLRKHITLPFQCSTVNITYLFVIYLETLPVTLTIQHCMIQ
jgi:hypothetical protein